MSSVLGPFRFPDAKSLVDSLHISEAAAELYLACDVIDLHIESYSFFRGAGYDIYKRHTGGLHRGLVVGQVDLPRLLEAGITGSTWIITGHPLRPPEAREDAFSRLHSELVDLLRGADDQVEIVDSARQYRAARDRGKHGAFLGIQGAHALPPDPDVLARLPKPLLRITLLHLTDTGWGNTSAPGLLRKNVGLGPLGHAFVERMNELRIGVDLSHISKKGFWDALATSDPSVPVLVTHTGIAGAHQHWRNLDDQQLKAIAARGGTVGIMYHSEFLGDPLFSGKISSVVRHVRHAEQVIGPDHLSLGSDWDGAICTPRDMPTCLELPRLVDALLKAGMREENVEKLLGRNALRVIAELKGE